MLEMNLLLIESDLKLVLQLIGNGASSDGSEHLAVFAGFDLDVSGELGNALGQFAHAVELMGLALGAALTQCLKAAFVCPGDRNGQTLRIKVIPGIAGCDLDLVGLGAQADDVMGENDFSFWHKKI